MASRSRMTQRALVERSTSSGSDDYGNPLPSTTATHIAAMPCWLYEAGEKEVVSEEATSVAATLKLMAPRSADITEQDRINGIKDRLGTVIEAGILGIETVMRKRTHKELTLSRVSS